MRRYLVSLGVDTQKVVRKRETGNYVADFYISGMDDPIAPARNWARDICHVLPDAKIVDTHDTIATWRKGKPVIYATVTFDWNDNSII
ncbi:MAG: hypothetical protein AAFV93_06140 [Chloroflexota bacterium]